MGQIFIDIGFASSLIATLIFISGIASKKVNLKFARIFFHGAVIFTIASAAYLMHLIITHQFQYTYVWEYSSKDLPFNLLISTFYAGQEGSFHLWAFFMAVLGVFLLAFITKRDKTENIIYEPHIMGIYSLLLTFLLFILIVKSPYNLVWESFPTDVKAGFVPPDGRGLNPLLQNFWMTIHPPILFLGFTSLAIPFCFAIAALIKNQYDKWLKLALPWTLFGAMILWDWELC
jgi:cytochrome c-type biogenesis protein CcmF